MTSTTQAPNPPRHHHHSSAAGMPTLTPQSLPASPTRSSSSTTHPHSHSHSYSDPSITMAAAVQSSSTFPNPAHAQLDPLTDDDADPMLAAAYLLSFMREQGANVAAKPRPATAPASASGSASAAASAAADDTPAQSQQDVVMHDADAATPVLEPALPPGLPSTMDLGDRASQPTSFLAPPPPLAAAAASAAAAAVMATSPNAPRMTTTPAPAPGSGTGVLIPSTTKKSSTRCKSLPSVLEYPDYLIPLNAPIQHKNLSLSQSAASSLASLPEEPALASPSATSSETPATPGRTSRKRPRHAAANAAAASSDEGELALDGLGDPDEAAAVKRARVGGASMAVDHAHDLASRAGSPTMDAADTQPLSLLQQTGGTRGRKSSSRRSGAPAAAAAASSASTSNSSASATPTTTPQLGRPSTTMAAAAKAANEAFLKEVVPDLSSLDPREAKRVRNTLSARASRARKAAKIEFLETRVNSLEALIDVVVDENAMLRKMLAEAGVQGVPESGWAKMPGAAPWPEQFRDSAPLFIGAQCGVASGSGGEEVEGVGGEGQDAGPKKKSSSKGKDVESGSASASGSVDGDVHMDEYQPFEPAPSAAAAYQLPSLTAPISLPSRPSSPTSSASQSYSSLSNSLPSIAAVVGDLPYPPAHTPRFPPPVQPQQQGAPGLPAGVYQPSYTYPAHTSASAASSRSVSPVRAAFPPPTSAPSTSR